MKALIFILSTLFMINSIDAIDRPPSYYLKNKISEENKRYATFHRALELLQERNAKILVETAASRCGSSHCEGDGGSSIIFSHWALLNSAVFFSVDKNESYTTRARSNVYKMYIHSHPHLNFLCSDMVSFLKDFEKPIDFLYLDGYDFDENNPFPSQLDHLTTISNAYPHLTENSVVLIDGSALPHGGKGKLAAQFLMERGWKILENAYQVLLIYPN